MEVFLHLKQFIQNGLMPKLIIIILLQKLQKKKVISKNATVGVYYWKKGSDYVNCAETMIKKNIRVNNEFYVCPVYNEAIGEGKKIVIDKVSEMHGLGTPDDLKNFITKKNLVN